jgi:two-component system OmpR family sensor kinase
MRTVSLTRRVSLASLAVLAVALLCFDAFLYVSFDHRLSADLRRQLTERAQLARSIAGSVAPEELARRLATGGITATVIAGGRRFIASSPPPPPAPGRRRRAGPPPPPRAPKAGPAHPAAPAGSTMRLVVWPLAGGERLVLTVSRSQLDGDLSGLLLDEAGGSAAVLLLAAIVLRLALGRALAPLDRTTAVATAIARGRARERLSPQRVDTELGRMAAAFDAMLDRLESALEAAHASEARMRQLLADAAHELRTPLQGIRAGAETLLRASGDPGEERLAVQIVRDSARASRLVDDLLTLGRLDGGAALEPAPIDLAELAREQLARAQVLAPALALRYEGPVRCPLRADRDRLAQVLVNLLDNARHATPDGGRVTLAIDPAGEQVRLTVSDSGPGVPADQRERIFDRFVRLDPSRSRARFGSGLGLPIARRIAEAHGGTLRCVAPPDGCGASFELRLPRAAEAPRTAAEAARAAVDVDRRPPAGAAQPGGRVEGAEPPAGRD